MSEYLIQGETLTDIADAIRAKTGGTEQLTPAQMVTEIENIETGGIDMGLEVLQLDNSGKIQSAVWHGNEVPNQALRYWLYNANASANLSFADDVTNIGDYAFTNAILTIDFLALAKVKTAGEYAFAVTPNAATTQGKSVSLLEYTGKTKSGGFSGSTFRASGNTFYQSYYLPKMQYIGDYVWYQNSVKNVSIQIGSVGYPVLSVKARPFGGSTGSGTITVYTTGELLDTIKTAIQNSAGANYTFVYKAAENTEYNGATYAAGDTMLTDGGA